MLDSPGRVSGSRCFRGDLAKKVAKQTATVIHCMHNEGFVHGGKSGLYISVVTNNAYCAALRRSTTAGDRGSQSS